MKKPNKNEGSPQGGDKPKTRSGLTVKEQLFVSAYLGAAKFNATQAARNAGYKGNQVTLSSVGYENLRKPHIAMEVSRRVNEAAMSASEVLRRLSRHASASLADVLTDDGEFDLELAKERGTDDLLKKLKVKKTIRRERGGTDEIEDVTYEYEIHDPQAALVHLGKYHKLFTEKMEHSNPDGTPLMAPVAEAMVKVYGPANAQSK